MLQNSLISRSKVWFQSGLVAGVVLYCTVTSAPAHAQVVVRGPVAPVLDGEGTGLCMASAVSQNALADFGFLNQANYLGNMNTFMEVHLAERVESVIRTVFDLSNNNPNGIAASFGDFTDAMRPDCQTGGCEFFINDATTAFGSRVRGYFNVTPDLVGFPIHFGIYADDAISLVFFGASSTIFPVKIRPPQLGVPTFRMTETVTFEEAGLYPVELLYVEIAEHAALELSYFIGSFQDFERPANEPPVVELDDAGFTLFPPSSFFQTISGAPSFPDLDQCQQCDRQFANLPGNNGCDGGYYCNDAALCAPCDTSLFCGPSCSPCGGASPFCVNTNEGNTCAECRDDNDCPTGFSCDPDTFTCDECLSNNDCPRGEVCVDKQCEPCAVDGACAGNSCNCCPASANGTQMQCAELEPGETPVCVECLVNSDCASGVCDVFVGRCVEELHPNQRPDCCGDDCVQCPGDFPFCLPGSLGTACAECRNDLDCGDGEFCLSGQCRPCVEDKHCGERCTACGGHQPFCLDGQTASRSFCVGCTDDSDCPGGTCDPVTHECTAVPECAMSCADTTPYCTNGNCVECVTDTQCPCGGTCDPDTNTCSASCKTNLDCLGTEHCRWTDDGKGKECAIGPMPSVTDRTCGGSLASACCSNVGRASGSHPLGMGLLMLAMIWLLRRGRRSRRGAS